MYARVMSLSDTDRVEEEFSRIGAYEASWPIMSPKSRSYNIYVSELKPVEANIIKQEMLSLGGDAAVSKGTIDCSVPTTSAILFGTEKILNQLVERLQKQPYNLPAIAVEIDRALNAYRKVINRNGLRWKVGEEILSLEETLVMGILNVTPDSFSDGGKYLDPEKAIQHAGDLIEAGADIIDIGGESTRPFSDPVPADEETKRVIPVIKAIAREYDVPISIDTYKPSVAQEAIDAGAVIINDVNGLRSDGMAELAADTGAGVVIMHMKGTPKNMQKDPHYDDLMGEIYGFFLERVSHARECGVESDSIVIDPGIGFGKSVGNNYEIIRRLGELASLGHPILVGPSRKSFIGAVLDLPPEERIEGTLAACVASIMNGASIVRVHDVRETKRAVRIADAIRRMK